MFVRENAQKLHKIFKIWFYDFLRFKWVSHTYFYTWFYARHKLYVKGNSGFETVVWTYPNIKQCHTLSIYKPVCGGGGECDQYCQNFIRSLLKFHMITGNHFYTITFLLILQLYILTYIDSSVCQSFCPSVCLFLSLSRILSLSLSLFHWHGDTHWGSRPLGYSYQWCKKSQISSIVIVYQMFRLTLFFLQIVRQYNVLVVLHLHVCSPGITYMSMIGPQTALSS